MRSFCSLAVLALLSACAVVAKADPIDYQTNVLDPASAAGASYKTHVETTEDFTATLKKCKVDELPGGNTGNGCFAVSNRSGEDWTSLTLLIPNTDALGGQSASCNTDTTALAYSSVAECDLNEAGTEYTLSFDDGVFPSGTSNTLFIVETGVPAKDFPTIQVIAGTAAVTPEPSSLLLLSTGLLAGCFWFRRHVPTA